ncbi:SusC/RagA family TonB-linked outer membrane protein [Niabella beijingensis]|uniref:SusC/RagA family TonB-linked outer membrane protein n=1 Tax=Niabella beijingensis TaxID=2872700 RepID=UPI001CBEE1A7|nr:SusC/RagA family TonB-linked outer membrane protein [Niabella beijingensis]MBZ4190566.1 SusC/RagA family TonB-linked outer membrane protein [Niabella beijingensis]
MFKIKITFACFFAYVSVASAQITGRVISVDREPLVAATLTLANQGQSAITDRNGAFVLILKKYTDTVIVTHTGYDADTLILTKAISHPLTIILQRSAATMEQVIVSTGLQKIPKERATGSFTVIDNKKLNEQVGKNIIDRLQYISNGYTALPARNTVTPLYTIRGLSTFTTSIAKPLVIVDNFEYQGDINNINPNDVENVTFLKDAAAGSIWGARAANGVIVITTKKGSFNKPTTVEVNANVTIGQKPDLFYNKNIASADFIDLEKFLYKNGYYSSQLTFPQYYPLSPVVNLLDKADRGILTDQQVNSEINRLKSQDVRNDYGRYFYTGAQTNQFAVNVTGGTKIYSWLFSSGFDDGHDELFAKYKRINFRLENTYMPVKNLEATVSAYYTQSKTTGGRPSFGSIATISGQLPPYISFADGKGNPLPVYTNYNSSYIDTAGAGKLLDWNYYPLNDYKYMSNQQTLQSLNATFGLRYIFLKHFNLEVKYRYLKQTTEMENIFAMGSFFTRNLINVFTQIDGSGTLNYKIPKGDIFDLHRSEVTGQNIRTQLNFSNKWAKHELSALAGMETSETVSSSYAHRMYGYNAEILTTSNVDYTTSYPMYPYGTSGFIPDLAGALEKRNDRLVSVYGNAAYTYNRKYILSLSGRRDASNIFGANTNDKWKPLWSTGLSWDIAKESFYKIDALSYLRIRTSYGHQGNIDPTKVAATTIRYSNVNPLTLTPYSVVDNFYNPDLRWEQVGMFNMGVDWSIKNKRLAGSIEYYTKKMSDLYASAPIESTAGTGLNTVIKNVGVMKGYGWDIELNSVNLTGKFKWLTNFILNTYSDKVVKANEITSLRPADLVGGTGSIVQGYGLYSYFAFKWAGLDPQNGDPQGYLNGTLSKDYGQITGDGTKLSDLVYIGSLLPRYYGSMGNTFSWNGLSLTIRLIYKLDYFFKRESINYTSLISNSVGHSDYSLRWQHPGDEMNTSVPSFAYPVNTSRDNFYQGSQVLATPGDHIRLQYINVSYNLKNSVLKNVRAIHSADFYIICNNVGLVWKKNKYNIDPDYSNTTIPEPKNIALGMRIGF